jgi:hypothetical protein
VFRLLGFCFGSIASMGALFLLIGTPDFHLDDADADRTRFDEAVEKLKAKQPAPSPPPAPVPVAEQTEAPAAEPAESAASNDTPPPAPDEPEPEYILPDDDLDLLAMPGTAEQEWHSFWTPFRTQIAAAGFVGRLESVTGLDYRIVKAGKAGYEVEFSYYDATELDSKLERISAATGLDLSRDLP